MKITDWRQEEGIQSETFYKKRFAFTPKLCTDGTRVWFTYYYVKEIIWRSNLLDADGYYHKDISSNISEAEFIIVKLTEQNG